MFAEFEEAADFFELDAHEVGPDFVVLGLFGVGVEDGFGGFGVVDGADRPFEGGEKGVVGSEEAAFPEGNADAF